MNYPVQRLRQNYPLAAPLAVGGGIVGTGGYIGYQGANMLGRVGRYAGKKAVKYAYDYATSSGSNKTSAAPIKGKSGKLAREARRKKLQPKKIKSNKNLSSDVVSLKKQVQTLKLSEDATLGRMTYRKNNAYRLLAGDNAQSVSTPYFMRTTDFETVLSNLKYYDPANPATLVTADGTTGTYQKDFLFKSVHSRLNIRNSYGTDAHVIVYECIPRVDTNVTPGAAWTDGVANDPGNITSSSIYNTYPSDFDTFKDFWRSSKIFDSILTPGETGTCSSSSVDIKYDPSFADTHNLVYQKGLKTKSYLIILKGVLAHDSALDQQGISACGIDIEQRDVYVVEYDAGVNLSYVMIDNTGLATPTNGFVQGQKPVNDNQAYSVA